MLSRLLNKIRAVGVFPRTLLAALTEIKLDLQKQRELLQVQHEVLQVQRQAQHDALQVQLQTQCEWLGQTLQSEVTRQGEALEVLVQRLEVLVQRQHQALQAAAVDWTERNIDNGRLMDIAIREVIKLNRQFDDSWQALQNTLKSHSLAVNYWKPEDGDRIRRILRLLQPMEAVGHRKIRLGRDFDGGYVMLDDFEGIGAAISMGINDDVSWDLEIARKGIHIYQYDHTIDHPPAHSDQFIFYRQRVGPDDHDGAISLDTILSEKSASGNCDLIVKMDIESDEWPVLSTLDGSLLASCSQFVCEFHHLDRLGERDFYEVAIRCLEKMTTAFFVCHIHANNCGNVVNVGNVVIPETLEVTFANRQRYECRAATNLFPTDLDLPNQPGRADIFLGTFSF